MMSLQVVLQISFSRVARVMFCRRQAPNIAYINLCISNITIAIIYWYVRYSSSFIISLFAKFIHPAVMDLYVQLSKTIRQLWSLNKRATPKTKLVFQDQCTNYCTSFILRLVYRLRFPIPLIFTLNMTKKNKCFCQSNSISIELLYCLIYIYYKLSILQ